MLCWSKAQAGQSTLSCRKGYNKVVMHQFLPAGMLGYMRNCANQQVKTDATTVNSRC